MKETLEIKDLDFLANLMLVFFHAGEICIRATEDYYKDRYRASQEYQQLRKKYGKEQADMIVGDGVNKMLRHNEKYQYGKIIKQAEQLKSMMDEVTAISIGSVNCKTELTVEEKCNAYDYLMKDARWLCKIYSMICNCEKKSDIVKIESTIKLLAKGDMASEKVISRFE